MTSTDALTAQVEEALKIGPNPEWYKEREILDAGFDALRELRDRVGRLEARDAALREMVDAQAEDGGLWFVPRTAPEAYLQGELRRVHALIEQDALTLRLLGQP